MAIKLHLSSQIIYDKVFKICPNGYDALAVDEFLDRIIKDYKKVEENSLVAKSEIDKLNGQIEDLKKKITNLEIDNSKMKEVCEAVKNNKNASMDNIDLLKKITRLEKHIYRVEGIDPNSI